MYLLLGDAKTARSVLESIIPSKDDGDEESQPWHPVVLTATWGLVYITEGDLETGYRFYSKAERLALDLKNGELARTVNQKMHLELARAYFRQGDYQNARKQVRQGLAVHDAIDDYERDLHALDKRLDLGSRKRDSRIHRKPILRVSRPVVTQRVATVPILQGKASTL